MAKRVKIPGRLESAETGNIVTGADAVMDDEKGKTQVVINSEVDAAIINLAQGKQDNLTFDSAPTEDSPNPVTSAGVYTADKVLSDAIEAILLLIPSAASALNKLADKSFVNSSIATATATFRGTYNLVSDLHLTVNSTHEQIAAALGALSIGADNNDYLFVQVPTSDTAPTEISKTERYKFNGTAWSFEYDLNNSGFTAAQWAAINSGVTSVLVNKLVALPTNAELVAALAGKQNVLTFDNIPIAGSQNPVKSAGIYARNNEIVAMINALDAEKQDVLTFDSTPTNGSTNPVTSNGVYLAISLVQAAVVALDGRMSTAETNIVNLQAAYAALTQSDIVVVDGPLPSTGQQQNVIYRQPDPDHTPPQFYSDYMWNGTAWVLMATYNNAIDDEPTAGSQNLVKSGGVAKNIVFDISKYNAIGSILATYADISEALGNGGSNIPEAIRQGGMSVKFVLASENEYCQYRLKTELFSNHIYNWERVDNINTSNISDADLEFSDEGDNVLVKFHNGGIQTKGFDSREIKLRLKNTLNNEIDFAITDDNSNIILELLNGGIKTKNFDSEHIRHFGSFSIIGDSYSAFMDYVEPTSNAVWYPTDNPSAGGYNSGNDVVEIEQMWFYKFAKKYKSALIQNDSYSGSTICYDGYSPGHDSGGASISFCRRIERLTKSCELLLIFGGTNDSWAGSSIGDYKYNNWTEEDKEYFRPALAYLIDYINKHHIGTQIVFILNTGLSSDINMSIKTICEHYSVPLLELSDINKLSGHPSITGMMDISEQLITFLKTL